MKFFCRIVVFTLIIHSMSNAQELTPEKLIGQGNPHLIEKDGYRLRPAAASAFDAMRKAALKDGIDFKVISSYRSYAHQNRIWERKYRQFTAAGSSPEEAIEKIIEYSTIPGTSRHHWGTDIDIVDANGSMQGDVLVASKFHDDGPFVKLKEWMDLHAQEFGFYLVYTRDKSRKGFNYEPWHYSFKPLSQHFLSEYKKLELQEFLQEQQLLGSDHFTPEFIARYLNENILDINTTLLP